MVVNVVGQIRYEVACPAFRILLPREFQSCNEAAVARGAQALPLSVSRRRFNCRLGTGTGHEPTPPKSYPAEP